MRLRDLLTPTGCPPHQWATSAETGQAIRDDRPGTNSRRASAPLGSFAEV
ncbi:hypothetical protein [Streptomyces purpureus]|uniref:Uncharacterized protein n=1 Tax=Streptomyces purpureus TaxID=1951 RepID=A0A918HCF8_9ACTN|nr:hypothetical protein GCM10014713_54660 [Streptomyces purpureus]